MSAHLPKNPRDEQTLELLVQGNPSGLQQLLRHHGGVVRAFLHRKFCTILHDWQLDEAMSLAMIRVWESAPRIEATEGTLRAWFAVIARNRATTLVTQREGDALVAIDDINPALLGIATSRFDAARLRFVVNVDICLQRLERMQRTVLLADLNSGTTLPASVLGERLRVRSSKIETARTVGRRELRKMLEQLGHYADEVSPATPPTPSPRRPDARR